MNHERQFRAVGDGAQRTDSELPSQIGTPGIGAARPRFRKGNAISWSFVPCRPPLSPYDAAAPEVADQPLTTPLIVWIDSNDVPDCIVVNQPCIADWLHVVLNGGVSSLATTTPSKVLTELRAVIALLAETYSVASNHVYLAATGVGAAAALRLLLMQPEVFRGIAMINFDLSALPVLIGFDHRLNKLRAMLVTSTEQSSRVREALEFGRLLHTTGMRIATHIYAPGCVSLERMLWELAEWARNEHLLRTRTITAP